MPANFPTTPPALYADKTTANDVNDAAHWDGANANIVKAEIVAIAAKVGVNGDASPSSHDYKLAALAARKVVTTGSGTLAASTSTVVNDAAALATSTVIVQARAAAFTSLDVYVSAKASGSFTLTHSSAAGTETFDYIVVN